MTIRNAGLEYHGDAELAPGLTDLAVNVRRREPPDWLQAELASTLSRLAAYPDPAGAAMAVAERHGRRDDEVLLTAGAAIPDDADLVIIGNPTNSTSVLHPAACIAGLARPGRVIVVDEAFMDAVPGEPETLAGSADVPGLLVVRSLTKTWGLAGLP
jgi:histidinol-phosphate aminotransferase